MRSTKQSITDKKGFLREIQFIHIYKYEKNQIKRNRMFVKEHDGSLCEVPQSKILLRDDEL